MSFVRGHPDTLKLAIRVLLIFDLAAACLKVRLPKVLV